MIRTARVHERPDRALGARWFVERLWPRGLTRASLDLDGWAEHAAPSDELRRWFDHDPARWEEFRRRYVEELDAAPATWRALVDAAREGDLVLLHSARDTERNSAVVLADHLGRHLVRAAGGVPDEGGGPVCYLHLVCSECGYIGDGPPVPRCARCGAVLEPDT